MEKCSACVRETGCLEVVVVRKVAYTRWCTSLRTRACFFLASSRRIFLPHPLSRSNLSIVGFRSPASLVNWFLSRSLMPCCWTNARSRSALDSDGPYRPYNNERLACSLIRDLPRFCFMKVSTIIAPLITRVTARPVKL